MATELEVQLTADIKRLESQLSKAEARLKGFGATADKEGRIAQRGFTNAGKGAANAVPTLQEFSRVIQDAPFGIQGVANNITQLTSNFGNLSRAAGGTLPALRLVLGSLAGPAGILFAVSTVTSLLVVFSDQLFKSSKSADGLAKSLERLNDLYGSELRLSKAIEENLKLQGKSTTEILNRRRDILKEQLAGISALIQQQQQLLQIQILENQTVSNWEAITGYYKIAVTGLVSIAKLSGAIALATLKSSDTLKTLLGPLLLAEKAFKSNSKANAASAEDLQKQQELQIQLNNLLTQQKNIENEILKINKEQTKEVGKRIGQAADSVISSNSVSLPQNPVISAPVLTTKVRQNLTEAEIGITEAWLGFKDNLNGLFAQAPIEGLTSFSQTIGNALGQGGNVITSIGNGILGAMGGFLSQFGKQLISYGVAALAFSKVTKALTNPITAGPAAGAAIAAGVALTAAGAALQSTIRGGFSTSGVSSGSSGGPSFSGATVSTGGGFNGRVVFEISGQKLIGVLNNSLSANQRLGGNVSLG